MPSVLQEMTKGIVDRKASKAAGLTPVAGETTTSVADVAKRGIPDVPEVFLTNEAVADIARDLRSQAATLVAVADALDLHTDTITQPRADRREDTKAAERAADAKIAERNGDKTTEEFAADFLAKQSAAQAATFTTDPPVTDGWDCPDHPGQWKALKARGGSTYRACTLCERYED